MYCNLTFRNYLKWFLSTLKDIMKDLNPLILGWESPNRHAKSLLELGFSSWESNSREWFRFREIRDALSSNCLGTTWMMLLFSKFAMRFSCIHWRKSKFAFRLCNGLNFQTWIAIYFQMYKCYHYATPMYQSCLGSSTHVVGMCCKLLDKMLFIIEFHKI